MDKDLNKQASKEELAKQIARNMAKKTDDTDINRDDKVNAQSAVDDFSAFGDVSKTKNDFEELTFADDSKPRVADHTNVPKHPHYDENASRKSAGARSAAAVKTAENRKNSATSAKSKNSNEGSKKNSKKKKTSGGKTAAIVIGSIALVCVAAMTGFYFYGLNNVQDKFLANTTINGVDVSGKTQKEVYDIVLKESPIPEEITIIMMNGDDISIPLSKIDYKDNIQQTISLYYSQQNHYTWFKNLLNNTEYNFDSTFEYNEDKLREEINRKLSDSPTTTEPKDAYIQKKDDDFVVVKEVTGDKIQSDKFDNIYKYVDEMIESGDYVINISGVDCYQKPKVVAADLEEEVEKLNALNQIEINFDFSYTTETLSGDKIMEWITFDDDDAAKGYTVDEDKVMAYVEKLADEYDTYGKPRKFKTTKKGEITIDSEDSCYGWWIDKEKTAALIVDLIEEGSSADTEPIYYKSPYSAYEYVANSEWRTADKDYGNTYIEIDLASQHLWYYKDGKVEYECDIVSGLPTKERNTPEGVYKLWYKEKDKVLKGSIKSTGETWETPVTYWNNITTFGVGLHDATWHPYFGGTRYKTNGSHGCINMPYDAAKYVYENIPMGTPVFAYWQ